MNFRIISVIGFSGSGKTNFITDAIELIKKKFNYNIAVIKNVKHHPIDEKGKDSYKFSEVGAIYSVIQNVNNEMAIMFKKKDFQLDELLDWLAIGPFKLDIVFTEGFRNLKSPTVLCISDQNEIQDQFTKNIRMISGLICSEDIKKNEILDIPIINIKNQFSKFLQIFEIT